MADDNEKRNEEVKKASESFRKEILSEDLSDPEKLIERMYLLWWHWADFHLYITTPSIEPITPPLLVKPEKLPDSDDVEFVYDIHDHGYKLSTSKSEDMFVAGMSNCKLFYTIEKMISMLIDRLKSGGIDPETEVQIAFYGHEMAQRKAFESVINLQYNVVVTNFDPGAWGEHYLEIVKRLADKGYGYPPEAPRDSYKQGHGVAPASAKR